MSLPHKVFVDSDVVISSLLSSSGAAHWLLNQKTPANYYVSDWSVKELKVVVTRLGLSSEGLQELTDKSLKLVKLAKVDEKFQSYVTDPFDAHIVAGAVKAEAKFLVSYNRKHFKAEKIKQDLDIILMTPAQFLQFLRQ